MKLGQYVRTDTGDLWQPKSIDKLDKGDIVLDYDFWYKESELEFADSLLDLIKPLDLLYVDFEGIKVCRIPETLNEVRNCRKRIESGDWKLLGITTKENIHDTMYMTKWEDE